MLSNTITLETQQRMESCICFWMNPDSIYLIQMVVQGFITGKMKDTRTVVFKKGTDLEAEV